MAASVQHFVQGLKSRNEETRLTTATALQRYINTEVQELSAEQNNEFMTELNECIYEMVASSDNNEKKGAILGIVSQIEVDDANHGQLLKFYNVLRNLFPSPDVGVMEIAAQAMGRMAASSGTYRTEHIEFQVRRSIEWLGMEKNEGRRHAAVFILKEMAVSSPTIFYQQIQSFFENIFYAIHDSKQAIRDCAIESLRAALALVVQRETKDSKYKPVWYKTCYDEVMSIMETSPFEKSQAVRDDRVHSSLVILLELLRISNSEDDLNQNDASILGYLQSTRSSNPAPEKSRLFRSTKQPVNTCTTSVSSHKHQTLPPPLTANNNYVQTVLLKSQHCCDLIAEHFDDVCSFVISYRGSRNTLIQRAIMSILPRLVVFNPNKFNTLYLSDAMNFLFTCLKKEKDRSTAFYAIGLMSVVVKTAINLYTPKIFEFIKQYLPPKEPNAKKQRSFVPEPAVFSCISMLAKSASETTIDYIHNELLQPMFKVGLNAALMQSLHELNITVPSLRHSIHEGVLRTLSSVLLPKNFQGAGDQSSSSSSSEPDVSIIVLALHTLATFQFFRELPRRSKVPPSPFIDFCMECSTQKYLCHENTEVRLNAVATVVALMRPSIPAPCTSANQTIIYPVLSPKLVKIVESILHLAICDTAKQVRLHVLNLLDERFDSYLILSENLNLLFVALHDEAFEVQEMAIQTIGRLSELNPAYVMPMLRKTHIQLIADLEHSGVGKNKLQAARLLGHFARSAPNVMKAYVLSTMKTLIMKLQDDESTSSVSVGIMRAIGDLAEVGGPDVNSVLDQLIPIILSMLRALSCFPKREVALITLGKVVESTGYVVKPYYKCPQLLDILLNFLKTEQSLAFRKEVMKVLGLIGTLDPYKHKQNQGSVEDGLPGTAERRVKKDSEFNVSEMLVSIGATSEEFYAAVSIATLMRVLRDPLLSSHHKAVVQAVNYMFQSLGVKCVPYLSEIIPTYLTTIKNCDPSIKEFLFKNLGLIISTVKQHVRSYMDNIFAVITEFWNMGSSMQATLISLTEQIAAALASEFKLYLPQIIPHALKIFMYDESPAKAVTLQLLHALQVYGINLDDYSHMLLPPMMQRLRALETPTNIKAAILETLCVLCECIDLRQHMSQIVHPLAHTLDNAPDLQSLAVKTLCGAVRQFGSRYSPFIPMIDVVMQKHRIANSVYETLISQITKGTHRNDEDAFLWSGVTKAEENQTSSDFSITKKQHIHTINLQKAWTVARRVSKDDWHEWLRNLSVELLKQSPSLALKACGALAKTYTPLARHLFNAAFLSCWSELDEGQQDELVHCIQLALEAPDVPPEVTHTLLNLAEFMEHTDTGPLPMCEDNGVALLGETAARCRAFAKALHYKELEFHKKSTDEVIGDLININSKLGQPEAADGVLEYHINNIEIPNPQHNINVEWYERLHKWEEAKQTYHYKLYASRVPTLEASGPEEENVKNELAENKLGYMRCLEALGEWSVYRDDAINEHDFLNTSQNNFIRLRHHQTSEIFNLLS
ncbi:unnamed protein product [Clavelina lepadiformis]|uniref:Serine/threonine-protein kinase TOR n=1 Tax=Clavelina lepadiformis TaxID=159417 RepID=A0ABP0F4D7_CLALP